MRWCRFSDANMVFTSQGSTSGGVQQGVHASYPLLRAAVYHCLADRIGVYAGFAAGHPWEFTHVTDGIYVGFTTVVPLDDPNINFVSMAYPGFSDYGLNLTRTTNLRFVNNIVPFVYVYLDASNTAQPSYLSGFGNAGLNTDTNNSYRWAGICAINPETTQWYPDVHTPSGTPGQVASTLAVKFKNLATRNYRLARVADGDPANSPFLGLSTDNGDPGCDIDTMELAITINGTPVGTP